MFRIPGALECPFVERSGHKMNDFRGVCRDTGKTVVVGAVLAVKGALSSLPL